MNASAVLWVVIGIQVPCPKEMKCPTCLENTTPDRWVDFVTDDPRARSGTDFHAILAGQSRTAPSQSKTLFSANQTGYSFDWMRCANDKCRQLVIRIHATTHRPGRTTSVTESWTVVPRFGSALGRFVDPIVPASLRDDLNEAAAILDLSPRMSAVLARRILADLLEQYAGHKQYGLPDRIDAFNKNTAHPRALRESLHRFRELADLGAHTKTSDQGEIIKIERDESEWVLGLVERLFRYLIVDPAADKEMHAAIDEKIQKASRKPIKPLPDDSPKAKP